MVVRLVSHGNALLLQLLQPLAVYLNTAGAGFGYGVVPEYPAHVVEQSRHRQYRGGWTVSLLMVQEELRVLVALVCGLRQPVDCLLLIVWHFLSGEMQLTQHILSVGISLFC